MGVWQLDQENSVLLTPSEVLAFWMVLEGIGYPRKQYNTGQNPHPVLVWCISDTRGAGVPKRNAVPLCHAMALAAILTQQFSLLHLLTVEHNQV